MSFRLINNFTSPRNLVEERHVSPAKPVFVRGRPSSPRKEVAKKVKPVMCIISLVVSPSQMWHVVQHKKFPERLSKT